MTLSDLTPGLLLRGPSGTRYRVVSVDGKLAHLRTDYPTESIHRNCRLDHRLTVDAVALEKFTQAEETMLTDAQLDHYRQTA